MVPHLATSHRILDLAAFGTHRTRRIFASRPFHACQAAGKPLLPRDLEAAKASTPLYHRTHRTLEAITSLACARITETSCAANTFEERIIGRFVQQELRSQPGPRKALLAHSGTSRAKLAVTFPSCAAQCGSCSMT